MDANTRTPQEIFGTHIRYVIPPFQRQYVWEEEPQWQPLWMDVARTAEYLLEAEAGGLRTISVAPSHFFGAVVLQQADTQTSYVQKRYVVDGQQRLTTLQLLMNAVQEVVARRGNPVDAKALRSLVLNDPDAVRRDENDDETFKVWPSRVDRAAFRAAMTNGADIPVELRGSRIVRAHRYFTERAEEWAELDGNPKDVERRLRALTTVLHRHLQLVAIDLSTNDNPQVIFETLNDRGTPLLAADLIKNFVFLEVEQAGADVVAWEPMYWGEFDDPWWKEDVPQGRYVRPRIDIFLHYWLTMHLQEDVPSDEVFQRFRGYARNCGVHTIDGAQNLLSSLRADAKQFRGFADFAPGSPEGTFYYRVVEALQLGVVTPVLLWLLAGRHDVPASERAKALAALESWVVRRMLLRLTTKDINRLVVALLKLLHSTDPANVGSRTERFLAEQSAFTRQWPSDDDLLSDLSNARLYNVIAQSRIRMVLEAIEEKAHTEKSEFTHCPRGMQIEHVMPKSWQQHWADDVAGDPVASAARDRMVGTLGNLTLVTERLNPALANLPWRDDEAEAVKPGTLGKRSQLDEHSQLLLNRRLVRTNPGRWTEADIKARSTELAKVIISIWPRPVLAPYRLAANAEQAFIGSFVRGTGFIMPPDDARALIVRDSRNRDVLFPYLSGEDLVSSPTQSASRWVINFHDWPEDVASTYTDCFGIVKEGVKSERERNPGPGHKPWWQYERLRPKLYDAISGSARVLVVALVSKMALPVWVPTRQVFSQMLGVFTVNRDAYLSLLSSNLHLAWAWKYASMMNADLRYTLSEVFETFPQPVLTGRMDRAGEELDSFRHGAMAGRQVGLTKLYNLVHDPANTDEDIRRLRAIHIEIDLAMVTAYGWDDLDLSHGFHDTRQGRRFTIAPQARMEVLERLLEENHQRHQDEVVQASQFKGERRSQQIRNG